MIQGTTLGKSVEIPVQMHSFGQGVALNYHTIVRICSLEQTQSSSSVVGAADAISEGPGFESRLGHHFSKSWFPANVSQLGELTDVPCPHKT